MRLQDCEEVRVSPETALQQGWLLMESSGLSPAARIALFCLIGLLLLTLGFLIAFVVSVRRRGRTNITIHRSVGGSDSLDDDAMGPIMAPEPRATMSAGGALAVATSDEVLACPTCRREYQGLLRFCPHDSRELVPAGEMMVRPRKAGTICPACSRAFDPGVRFCSHDATELIPVPVYEATRGGRVGRKATGVMAKICPQCRHRYDLAAAFCAKDGAELAVIN